jgi:diadenosine tetraphosphatase ApaH/serine/threonine PP2A family protein phosphatase
VTFAVFSDIHANALALQAALQDARELGIDCWYCLGDVIGYGPDPQECVKMVMNQFRGCIYGNHEKMLESIRSKKDCSDYMASIGLPLEIAWSQLNDAGSKKWLRSLKLSLKLDGLLMLHAAPYRPELFGYILNEEDAAASFECFDEFVVFNGHSHVPVIWEKNQTIIRKTLPDESPIPLYHGSKYIVNVGSVGQPRDNNPKACYAIYDSHRQIIWFRRVEYDIEKAQERFIAAGLPSTNWRRLSLGH